MWQYIDYSPELYHHGILGQKWGIRRFQNSDGTLTEAGRKRYRVDSKGNLVEKTKAERKADAKAEKAAKAEQHRQNRLEREKETLEKKKERIAASRDPQMIYENKDLFSFQELSDLYNVMQKEKQIQDMIPKGKTYMDKVRETSKNLGDVATAIENGSRFYNSIAKVSNSIFGTDLPKIEESKESPKEKARKEAQKEADYYKNLYLIEQNKKNLSDVKTTKKETEEERNDRIAKEKAKSDAEYYKNLADIEANKKKLKDIKSGKYKEDKEKEK